MNEEVKVNKEEYADSIDTEKKPDKRFKKIIIVEVIILVAALFVFRGLVFPVVSKTSMLHVEIAMHSLMIGLTASCFSVFAILFKRVWKTHKKYVLLPAIFTVFGYLMLMLANELNF